MFKKNVKNVRFCNILNIQYYTCYIFTFACIYLDNEKIKVSFLLLVATILAFRLFALQVNTFFSVLRNSFDNIYLLDI